MEGLTAESVVQGILIGVSSGAILTLFFGVMSFVNMRRERSDQVKYLANEMKKFRDLIHQATDLKLQLGPQFVNHSQAQVRKAYFEDMRRQVETILENRASRLSADEIMDVRNVFFTDLFPGVELNSSGYDRLFSELSTIKWLDLPELSSSFEDTNSEGKI